MDFVIDNYIIIIVVAVILIMALIGYLAEKTDFIHENKEKKRSQKKKFLLHNLPYLLQIKVPLLK